MADTKITDLTAATTVALTDILPIVASPGGSPVTKKITLANFLLSAVSFQTWNPTLTGFSANPTSCVYRYVLIGKLCTLFIRQATPGTSNGTGFTITLPFTAAAIANMAWWVATAGNTDNGVLLSGAGAAYIASGGTVLNLFSNAAAGSWTASGTKGCFGMGITYEVA
jgi:hypothetical protein